MQVPDRQVEGVAALVALAKVFVPLLAITAVGGLLLQGPEADLGLLGAAVVIVGGGALVARATGSTLPGLLMLLALALLITSGHATSTGARNSLGHIGVLFILGSFLLPSRRFQGFGVVVLVLAAGARTTRILLGNAGPDPIGAGVSIVLGLVAFFAALWVLDRRHRSIHDRLVTSLRTTVEARQRARDASVAKGRFLANMSHELRTPLNAILGYAELLEDEAPEHAGSLGLIRGAGRDLLAQVDRALEQARREASEPDVEVPRPTAPVSYADRTESDAFLARWLVGAGGLAVGVCVVSIAVGSTAGDPPHLALLLGCAGFGATVGVLGWTRRTRLGIVTFLLGAYGLLAYAIAELESAQEVYAHAFFSLALAGIALPLWSFVRFNLVVFLVLGAALLRRLQHGWIEPVDAGSPMVSLVATGAGLTAMVHARTRHLAALSAQLAAAEEAQREAAEADRARDELVQGMSHSMRTPLTTILGYAELLQEELPRAHQADAARILRAGRHLLAVLESIADLRAMAAGELVLQAGPVPLGDVVEGAIELTRPGIEERENTLEVDPVPAWTLHGDRRLLQQVLTNLLSNAGKYTRGGRVRVLFETEPDRLRVHVEDDGEGVAPDALSRLFVPFERVTRDASIGGTGLGLTIARRLAELHDGTVTATSELGRGSRFTVELPARAAAVAP